MLFIGLNLSLRTSVRECSILSLRNHTEVHGDERLCCKNGRKYTEDIGKLILPTGLARFYVQTNINTEPLNLIGVKNFTLIAII